MHDTIYKNMLNAGESNKSAKLSELDVLILRRNSLLQIDQPLNIISKVSKQSIYSALTGRTWKYLPMDIRGINNV